MATTTVLEREMFSEAEAARLLQVRQSTLHYWLEGGVRGERTYRPVIRPERRGGHPAVTWAEFIEAGLLREYRRTHGVPMAELRAFIDHLREHYDVPYPLAHKQPFVGGRHLLLEAQEAAGLDAESCLVAWASGQLILTPLSEAFVQRVTWADDIAAGWRPHDDPKSPVRMDPEVRFGKPTIRGVSTEALWEHVEAGDDDIAALAEDFNLSITDVRWALAYENSVRAA
jgi:uncharacterized protein (DUF433 family)